MSLLLRGVIVATSLYLLSWIAPLFGAMFGPFFDAVSGNAAIANVGWGASPGYVMFIGSIVFPLMGVALIVWMIFAPLKDDTFRGGFRF